MHALPLKITLPYRPAYDTPAMMQFLSLRAVAGLDLDADGAVIDAVLHNDFPQKPFERSPTVIRLWHGDTQ